MTSHLNRERQSFKELFYGYRDRERKAKFMYICTRTYLGFHEKGFLSYLCALGIDRQSPLNECTLLEPFIWNPMYYKMNLLNVFHVMFERRKDITFSIISGIFNSFTKKNKLCLFLPWTSKEDKWFHYSAQLYLSWKPS